MVAADHVCARCRAADLWDLRLGFHPEIFPGTKSTGLRQWMVVNDSPQSVGDVISQIKAEWGLDGRHIVLVRDGGRVRASLPATILKPGSTIFVEEVVGVAKPGVAVCRHCDESRRGCFTATQWKKIGSGLACCESCKGESSGDRAATKFAAGSGGAAVWRADAQEALSRATSDTYYECDDQSDVQTDLHFGNAQEEGSEDDEEEGSDSLESDPDEDDFEGEASDDESPAEGPGSDEEDEPSYGDVEFEDYIAKAVSEGIEEALRAEKASKEPATEDFSDASSEDTESDDPQEDASDEDGELCYRCFDILFEDERGQDFKGLCCSCKLEHNEAKEHSQKAVFESNLRLLQKQVEEKEDAQDLCELRQSSPYWRCNLDTKECKKWREKGGNRLKIPAFMPGVDPDDADIHRALQKVRRISDKDSEDHLQWVWQSYSKAGPLLQ